MSNLALQLASYAAQLRYQDLSPAAVRETKRRIIDALGCALGAWDAPPARAALDLALSESAAPGARAFGTAHRSSLGAATFQLGVLIRALDFNDTYLSKEPAHPSDNLAPCLAVAQARSASGREILAALVLGYEIQCRMADAASLRSRGWDHVTYGAFSSALLAARLMRLPAGACAQALNLAGAANVALRQTRAGELSMWKGCAFANAARNGVFAAQLAARGVTGPAPIFEGQMGFFKQVSGRFALPRLGGQGGQPFMIEKTSIKYFPAEYHAQSAIEAALGLRAQAGDPARLRSVEVQSFDAAVDIIAGEPEKWAPKTRETADHSLPYCVAVALMDGKVGLEQFSPRRLADPLLARLVKKVKVRRNAGFSRRYPASTPNLVKVVDGQGRVFSRMVEFPRGHARNPLSDREVEEKFRSFAARFFPARRIEGILAKLWNLEKVGAWDQLGGDFVIQGR